MWPISWRNHGYITTAHMDVYPGLYEMAAESAELCEPYFENYVGAPPQDSELFIWSIFPSDEEWEDGDRDIYCIVSDYEGKLTSSVRDSRL